MQTFEKNKENSKKEEYYSVDELDRLILSIKEATKLNEKEMAARIPVNEGYISQIRSRALSGKTPGISGKFMNTLRMAFKEELQNASPEEKIDARLRQIESNLEKLLKGQGNILDQQKYTRAEVKGVATVFVVESAADDENRLKELWALYRKAVGGAVK